MAIDLEHERLLTLSEAAGALPRLRGKKPVHVGTICRWIKSGVGGVRLEAVKIGRTLVTSREALQRFAERRTARDASSRVQRHPEAEAAERELDRHGL